ncbi:MAG: NAD(P)/FAD-dependent oxidoreductase [Bacteroidia bacterium]|nr:NAD(P)/FAD-dependent oxidoreductase [Bacteroidia bacterium]
MNQEKIFVDKTFAGKVLIIGAGVAGLYAGYLCQAEGIDFQILEASDKIGGRLGKVEGFSDISLDSGAEWLHGKKSIIGELVKQTTTKIKRDKSKEYYWFKGKLKKKLPRYLEDELEEDENPSDVSFLEYARLKGYGEEYKYIIEQLAGDYGADASELSAKWTKKEEEAYSAGFKDYKFRETYFDLFDKHLIAKIQDSIQLNTVVKKIEYRQDKMLVEDGMGNAYSADKVILTVPISVLKEGDISFLPPLPAYKIEAFEKIGMGAGMKIFLKFGQKFYEGYIAGGKICAAYADESWAKKGKDHILLAFVMGKQAEYLSSLESDQEIIEALLGELDEMYGGQASAYFLDAHIVDWGKHPFIRGAYSFSKVGIGNAREIAAQPIEEKIFFAGEAMNLNGHHQTVHGAAETAIQQLIKIRDSL